jgi:glycosyltransferase involved in cell wall biosynthesis
MGAVRYNVCLVNSADPRGSKIGGIETYLRDYIFYHPEDMSILFIGADEIGDLPIGKISEVTFRGRTIKFLPLYYLKNSVNKYPRHVFESEAYHFISMLLKNWILIRRVLREGQYTVELRRVEFAPFFSAMGVPFIQMVHIWGAKDAPMSGLQGKFWYVRDSLEYLAAMLCQKFYSVNSDMTAMYKAKYKKFAIKFDTLTTWANTEMFKPSPYKFTDKINVFFAGRMDKFKRPDIMFEVIAAVRRLNGDKVLFHYVGDGDPNVFPEFSAIADICIQHGRKTSAEIAALLGEMHIGILTSEFEGMPRIVMEVLTTGRPVVALHLPQLQAVVKDAESGFLVARSPQQIEDLAKRIILTYEMMKDGRFNPEKVARVVEPFSPRTLLGKIFEQHRQLHSLTA